MGGHPWFYFVSYEKDLNKCLHDLREQEFKAGRYNPAERFPRFPVNPGHVPGCKHASIRAAQIAAGADGTRSILDIDRIAEKPDFGAISPLDEDELMALFSTIKPTRKQIESNDDLFESIERGQGIFVIAYKSDEPSEIYFAGYSYD
ncbi:MAG: hypothetical protein WBX25_07055 [Rhodomicrobium sp.]